LALPGSCSGARVARHARSFATRQSCAATREETGRLFGVDDSDARRAEQRLRDDKRALAEAKRALTEQCRRTLTRPSTLALLVVAGGLLGARPKAPVQAAQRRRAGSVLGAILRSIWAPLFRGVTAVAVERALHRHHDEAEPASRRHDQAPGIAA
jgi:hypothetical protein